MPTALERERSGGASGELRVRRPRRARSRRERRSAQDIGRDFNRDWPDVTRTRETFVLAEEFAAG